MKKVLVIALLIIIGAVAPISFNKNYKSMTPSNINTGSQTVVPNSVSIQNFAFNPQTLTVKAGTTVIWTNSDSVTHSIKSSTFNSAGLGNGDTFKFIFNTPGTFDYSCGIHPAMTGTIIVQ